jgi:hypothetical protein
VLDVSHAKYSDKGGGRQACGRTPEWIRLESAPLMCPFRRPSRASVAPFLLVAAVGLGTTSARADEPAVTVHEFDPQTGQVPQAPRTNGLTYLSVGGIFSFVDSNSIQSTIPGRSTPWNYAVGLEGSVNHYLGQRIFGFGYGAFVQAQLESAKYLRCDVGAQVNAGPVGVELGVGMRQGDGTFATTGSLHTGFFLSVGYLVISYRVSPALFSFPSNEQSFGLDTGVSIALKLPIAIQGRDPTAMAIQANGHAW